MFNVYVRRLDRYEAEWHIGVLVLLSLQSSGRDALAQKCTGNNWIGLQPLYFYFHRMAITSARKSILALIAVVAYRLALARFRISELW